MMWGANENGFYSGSQGIKRVYEWYSHILANAKTNLEKSGMHLGS